MLPEWRCTGPTPGELEVVWPPQSSSSSRTYSCLPGSWSSSAALSSPPAPLSAGVCKYLYALKLLEQKYDGQIFTSSYFQVCAAQRRYSGMLAVLTSTPSTSCSLRGRSVSTCWWRGTRRSSSSALTLCSELRCDNLDGVGVHCNGGNDQ